MHILDRIVAHKRQEVASAQKSVSEAALTAAAQARNSHRSLRAVLAAAGPHGLNIIAEIKRSSPSKGLLRVDLDPADYARRYEAGGAAALSVLTDRHFFDGSPEDLTDARTAVSLPVLRKDFIVSTYQIYEAAAMGADAVLLVVRILEMSQLRDYIDLSRQLGMDALVEVHSEHELDTALESGAGLIGINNRDLDTFQIDLSTTCRLAAMLSRQHIGVCESGIQRPEDVARIKAAGIYNFLIGTSLVTAENPVAHLRYLMDIDP